MTTYIVLLRGINVGGKHIVKMAELRSMLESLGCRQVQTYIQSGNVVLESDEEPESLAAAIEDGMKRVFAVPAAVMLRSAAEFADIIERCPYSPDALAEGHSIHVSLLKEAPSPEAVERLADIPPGIDEYRIVGHEIYQLYRQKISDSKLPIYLQKLKMPATARNWQTMLKLAGMVKARTEGTT